MRALARAPEGNASFPDYERIPIPASAVIIPGLVLAEVDYFLRADRRAMRKLFAEIFDPATRYEYELPVPPMSSLSAPPRSARALEFDARFGDLELGLVDGTVAAIAERRQVYRILTTDRRDFSAIRVGARLTRAWTCCHDRGAYQRRPRMCQHG
ncbi:MAG: hypothetical protein ABSB15_20135 [Bryobacteraceae bacterium]